MDHLRKILPLTLGIAFFGSPLARAKPVFTASEIEGQGSEIIYCDLEGDHLKDAVLVDGLNLSIFHQDSKSGFPRQPQQQVRLDDRPAIVWPARLGRNAESLLVMTSAGVTELSFTSRTSPPTRRQIIQQPTIIPEQLDETPVKYFPMSTETGTDWPLLLLPVTGGLEVWQHRDGWQRAQFIEHSVETHIRPAVTNAGYSQSFGLSLSVSDVNGDGRDDLMIMRNVAGGMQTYALYLQTDGRFTSEPTLTYTNKADWRTALCWIDINRDGRLDLIKSTLQDDPSFLPGMRSGKVLIGAYLADAQNRIPAEPQQVFRKNDWSSALPVADVDGDGFMDMVLGYIPLNTREGFRKMITAEQIDFSLRFYFSRPGAGFPKDPDSQRDLVIHFDREFFSTVNRGLYYEQFVNLNGDFNGDGKKDLLVRDRSDAVSVYFFVSRETGFSPKADLKFNSSEPIDSYEVKDLNGDGVSDLIIKFQKRNAFRIFTSQSK